MPSTPSAATSEGDRREAEKEMRRAQRRHRQRFWRLMRSYRISFVMLLIGSAALGLVAWLLHPICVVGGSQDGACLGPTSYWTVWLLLASLLLMTNESPPDIVLLGTTTLLLLTGVISNEEAWRGVSSPSVLVIGVLFVVARALEETRAVEMLLLPMLGSPKTTGVGILRLCIPVAVSSAFLNNTPIVAMLLSVCEGWAARNGLSIHALLMPLSFASMLGGMCTLIGTSTNLVLNSQIENDPEAPLQPFTMFSMSVAGIPAAIVGILFLALAAPVLLRPRGSDADMNGPMLHVQLTPKSDAAVVFGQRANPPSDGGDNGAVTLEEFALPDALASKADGPSPVRSGSSGGLVIVVPPPPHEPASTPFVLRGLACYCIEVLVGRECSLVGQHPCALDAALAEKGRQRATEVVGLKRGSVEYLPGRGIRCDVETGDVWSALRIQPGDSLLVSCLGDAVPKLRALRGVTAAPDADDASLGRAISPNIEAARHHRRRNPRSWRLVEAVVSASSPLSGLTLSEALSLPALEQTIFWGIRQTHAYRDAHPAVRDGELVGSPRLMHAGGDAQRLRWSEVYGDDEPQSGGSRHRLRHAEAEDSASTEDGMCGLAVLHPGCTLLLEAPAMWVENHRTSRSFALLGVVGSSPVPTAGAGRTMARIRLAASLLALVALLALSATGTVELLPLALAIAYCLVGVGCITLEQAWRSISFRVLLTIACSFGLSSALTNTHVSAALATGLVAMAPVGPFPFLLLIFLFTSLLSCVVSNAATVVLLYSVLRTVDIDGLRPAQLMLIMMLGASSAFATPIGYQTNLMVLARGGYRFGDFALLGGGLTILTGLCVSLIVWALPESLF
jgi:di/tricarboxylate transporter